MDSLTQATLGAAVGEAVLGRKAGWRAPLWGAIAGTLPDLDIVAYPLLDEVARLSWHRGPSHAFFYLTLAAPLIAWGVSRIHKNIGTWRQWTLLIYLGLITHVLLDAFTVYGTQLFLPFSRVPVAWNSIAIIDPLYTLPLLVAVIVALIMRRQSPRRRIAIWLGLGLSTAYLLATVGIKVHVDSVAEQALVKEDIAPKRYMTVPTLFNALLWQITAEVDGGYVVSDYSLLDDDQDLIFEFVPRNDSLLKPIEHTPAVQRLRWFSQGYFVVTAPDGRLLFHDLRFGELGFERDSSYQYIFTWFLDTTGHPAKPVILEREELTTEQPGRNLKQLWQRMLGDAPDRFTRSASPQATLSARRPHPPDTARTGYPPQ